MCATPGIATSRFVRSDRRRSGPGLLFPPRRGSPPPRRPGTGKASRVPIGFTMLSTTWVDPLSAQRARASVPPPSPGGLAPADTSAKVSIISPARHRLAPKLLVPSGWRGASWLQRGRNLLFRALVRSAHAIHPASGARVGRATANRRHTSVPCHRRDRRIALFSKNPCPCSANSRRRRRPHFADAVPWQNATLAPVAQDPSAKARQAAVPGSEERPH